MYNFIPLKYDQCKKAEFLISNWERNINQTVMVSNGEIQIVKDTKKSNRELFHCSGQTYTRELEKLFHYFNHLRWRLGNPTGQRALGRRGPAARAGCRRGNRGDRAPFARADCRETDPLGAAPGLGRRLGQ